MEAVERAEAVEIEAAIVNEAPSPWSPERAAAKERIRLAYVSGKNTLARLAVAERIPYNTVMKWSSDEGWNKEKANVALKSDSKLIENIADWVAEQKTVQIKRAVKRSGALQAAIDKALADNLTPADIQALASAEERMDNVVRRNLGMDDQSGGRSSVSINILAGGVQMT